MPEVLLESSWPLSHGLHTTRRLLSTCVMITGHYPAQQEVAEGTDRRNGPLSSLKNGSFKEPLLSVHFAWALGMRGPWAVSLLQEREGATHYETANG